MRAVFGVVSLLVVLAIVGLISVKQMKAVGRIGATTNASASAAGVAQVPQLSGSGSIRDQSQQLQKQVVDDVAKAMSQGAASRQEEADKP